MQEIFTILISDHPAEEHKLFDAAAPQRAAVDKLSSIKLPMTVAKLDSAMAGRRARC